MIVGSYVLHLYCAAECAAETARSNARANNETVGQFSAYIESEARRKARRRGWIFARGEAWCSRACLAARKEK